MKRCTNGKSPQKLRDSPKTRPSPRKSDSVWKQARLLDSLKKKKADTKQLLL